jgi:site-specific DNA-methyltransferase (adenine-specific)
MVIPHATGGVNGMSSHVQSSIIKQLSMDFRESRFDVRKYMTHQDVRPVYQSRFGALFDDDCMNVLPGIKAGVVDTVFADPPFNLGKEYGERTNDKIPDLKYLQWCRTWIAECFRTLKPGGSFFLYNLPKWNTLLGAYLTEFGMEFRHWIAIEISACLPIPGRLHPSHYSLLYYSKGKPKTFRNIRTPIQRCRHCGGEIKDYGGHRGAMNPKGVNLKDVWTDIPPVRHWKFKTRNRRANALSTKLLDRVIELSTAPGDLILDPFGGSGTTYDCCEYKERHWIGIEIDFAKQIIERLENGDIQHHTNGDHVEE